AASGGAHLRHGASLSPVPRARGGLNGDDLTDLRNARADLVLDPHLQRDGARGAARAGALEADVGDAFGLVHADELDVPPVGLDVGADAVEDFVDLLVQARRARG